MEHRLNLSTVYSRKPWYTVNNDKLSMYWCKCSYLKNMLNLDIIHSSLNFVTLINVSHIMIQVLCCLYDGFTHSPLKILSKIAIWRLSQAVLWSPVMKWRLRNECRNSILMTCHYTHNSVEDQSKQISLVAQPNQKNCYPDPGSDTLLLWYFWACSSDILWGDRLSGSIFSEMSTVFLDYM